MTSPSRCQRSTATLPPGDPDSGLLNRRTSPVELFWDLVFVFAVTQVTTLMRHHLDWGRFGEAMLVLALVWWAWSAFVWAANAQSATDRSTRLALLTAMAFIFVSGLALPEAFTTRAVLFASTYAVVRFLHLGLYADASRKGQASWRSISGFAFTVAIGMGLLLIGAFADHTTRIVLWTAAIVIDYAGPAWLTRKRLRGLQRVAVAHFAERYSLFIIICLGESIVAIGAGATPLDAARITAVSLCLLITIALWWAYFDELAEIAEQRLREHDDPVLAAADGYSYIHLLLVAGIIVFAVGEEVHRSRRDRDAARRRAPDPLRRRRPVPARPPGRALAAARRDRLRQGDHRGAPDRAVCRGRRPSRVGHRRRARGAGDRHGRRRDRARAMRATRPTVSVVVPFAGTTQDLSALLTGLAALELAPGDELIVADNRAGGQSTARLSAKIVPAHGIRTPAYARNAGPSAPPASGWCSSTPTRAPTRRSSTPISRLRRPPARRSLPAPFTIRRRDPPSPRGTRWPGVTSISG